MLDEQDLVVNLTAEVEISTTDDNELQIGTSRSTQTDSNPQNDVLITASKNELMQRINSFTRFKRKQIDISNLLQFSRQHNLNEPEGEMTTCARVDTKYYSGLKRTSTSHIRNTEGPADGRPTLKDQLWAELVLEGRDYRRPEVTSQNVLMFEERVAEMEESLSLEVSSNTSLLQRIKNIETRVLSLEGTSKEYKQLTINKF